jgi:uncharacterized protein YigA (DUF484 family)
MSESGKARTPGAGGGDETAGDLDEAAVTAWLRANPDYFGRHPDLMDGLAPPARDFGEREEGSGEVVDLQQVMLTRLKAEVGRREEACNELIDAGRSNLQSQSRIHEASLALLGARSLDHLIERVSTDLPVILDIDASSLCLESGEVARTTADGIRVLPGGAIDEIMGADKAVLLRANVSGDARLFGESAGLVRSDALLRLRVREGMPHALLALGSRDPGRFHGKQGTELLGYLAHVMEYVIRAWLDLPRQG